MEKEEIEYDISKTADETLREVINDSPYSNDFSFTRKYILKAMELYAQQQVENLTTPVTNILEQKLKDMKKIPPKHQSSRNMYNDNDDDNDDDYVFEAVAICLFLLILLIRFNAA